MQSDPLPVETESPPPPPPPLQTTKFRKSETGKIEFEGDVTDYKTQEILFQLLTQAEYYRQNSQKLELEKIEKSNYDPVFIVFASVFLFLIMVIFQSVVSIVSQSFTDSNTYQIRGNQNVRIDTQR